MKTGTIHYASELNDLPKEPAFMIVEYRYYDSKCSLTICWVQTSAELEAWLLENHDKKPETYKIYAIRPVIANYNVSVAFD